MKIKELLNLKNEEFEKMMTNEEFEKMKELGMQYAWQLLNAMQDGARESGLEEDDEYVSVSDYLDNLEEMRN